MKIIFLDVDGVLNNPGTYSKIKAEANDFTIIETSLIKLLNKITGQTAAKIVLSSSWKHKFRNDDELKMFLNRGCGVSAEIIGKTPNAKNRGEEISKWIELFGSEYKIESFIILDDENNMGELQNHLVHINGAVGLTDKDVKTAIRRLNQKGR